MKMNEKVITRDKNIASVEKTRNRRKKEIAN